MAGLRSQASITEENALGLRDGKALAAKQGHSLLGQGSKRRWALSA